MLQNFFLQINTQTGAEAAEQAADIVPAEETLSILELIQGGGWYIMIPLAILSVIAVYIFIERARSISKVKKADLSFMNEVRDLIYDGKVEDAKKLCQSINNPYSRMILKGIMRIGKPMPDIVMAIEKEGELEVNQLEQSMSIEATISGAAPMIGFLGTVIGMITTFHEMSTSGNNVELDALSGGIMQAMVTTAAGLVIGIIAYLAYNLLVSQLDSVSYKMEQVAVQFTDMLQEPA